MKSESSDFAVKFDSLGRVELDLYLGKARQERADYMKAWMDDLLGRVEHRLTALYERFLCANCQASH